MKSFVAIGIFLSACLLTATAQPDIVFVSYNVENWLLMERGEKGKSGRSLAPKPENEKIAVIESIKELSPDILGIQEMGDTSQLEDFRNRLKTAGLDYPHVAFVDAADKARHVALLSKFPIVEKNSRTDIRFDLQGRPEYMQRGILDVTLQITDSYRLRVIGVHLKSRREVHGFDQALLRMEEGRELRKHLDAVLKGNPEVNLLAFGDFNDTKNEPVMKEIIGVKGTPNYMEDLLLGDPLGDRWTYWWSAADEYSRIDYILISKGLRPEISFKRSGILRRPQWWIASDHRPVYSVISPIDQPNRKTRE